MPGPRRSERLQQQLQQVAGRRQQAQTPEFKMKDLGEAKFLLGIEIWRLEGGGVMITQEKYAKEVVRRFGMEDSKPASTPLEDGSKLGSKQAPQTPKEEKDMEGKPYRSLVGSLMYLTTCTRPDLSMAVSTLSRFCSNPGKAHWEAARRVLRYVKGTMGEGLVYKRGEALPVWGYSDASYGTCLDTFRSRSGWVFMSAGGAVSWGSKLQEVVALSSCEAEYMGLTYAAQEGIYLRQLQDELEEGAKGRKESLQLLADNQASIKLANNPVFHKRSKHIAIKWHWIRERVENGEVEVDFVGTREMAADMLTKHATRKC